MVADLRGARLWYFDSHRRVDPVASESIDRWLYQLEWAPAPLLESATGREWSASASPTSWLVLADRTGVGEALANLIRAEGHRCLVAHPDDLAKPCRRRRRPRLTLNRAKG